MCVSPYLREVDRDNNMSTKETNAAIMTGQEIRLWVARPTPTTRAKERDTTSLIYEKTKYTYR